MYISNQPPVKNVSYKAIEPKMLNYDKLKRTFIKGETFIDVFRKNLKTLSGTEVVTVKFVEGKNSFDEIYLSTKEEFKTSKEILPVGTKIKPNALTCNPKVMDKVLKVSINVGEEGKYADLLLDFGSKENAEKAAKSISNGALSHTIDTLPSLAVLMDASYKLRPPIEKLKQVMNIIK